MVLGPLNPITWVLGPLGRWGIVATVSFGDLHKGKRVPTFPTNALQVPGALQVDRYIHMYTLGLPVT